MLAHRPPRPGGTVAADVTQADIKTDPAYQAFWLLRIGFTVAPILFGVDKFANVLVNWLASIYDPPGLTRTTRSTG